MTVTKGTCSLCDEETDVVAIGVEYICYSCACEIVDKFENAEEEDGED